MLWPFLACVAAANGQPAAHLIPRIHYTRPCVNPHSGSRDISGAVTIGDTHHVWQLCDEGWHHASSTDFVHWTTGGVDLDEWPSGFVFADDEGACAGFRGKEDVLVLRCATATTGAFWNFSAAEPMMNVSFYRFLPLDPFRPFRDRDGRYYVGVALDACNATTREAPCGAGGELRLWSSDRPRGGSWSRLPAPMLATNRTVFGDGREAHEFVTVEYVGFGERRVLLNNAYFARGSTEYFLGAQASGSPFVVESQSMLDWGEISPRDDGAGVGLGALNRTRVDDPDGGRYGMARCLGAADMVLGTGRRVCVADISYGLPGASGLTTQALPRELSVDGTRLLQRFARELRALRRGAVAADGPGLYPGGRRVELVATFAGSGAIVVLGGAEVVLDVERRIACVDATSQGVADVRCGPVDAAPTYVVHVIADHSLLSVIVSDTTSITAVARPDEKASTDVRLSGALVSADIYALAAAS